MKGCEVIVFRELVSGIYFGDRTEVAEGEEGPAVDMCTYTASEIRRIARLAGQMASVNKPPYAVTSVDKANVLATSRLWRRTVTEVFEKEFPDIKLSHHLVDSAAMLLASNPRKLNGIILSEGVCSLIASAAERMRLFSRQSVWRHSLGRSFGYSRLLGSLAVSILVRIARR